MHQREELLQTKRIEATMSTKSKMILWAATALFVIGTCGDVTRVYAQTTRRAPPKYSLAANTVMRLRMRDPLTSKAATVGQQFSTTVVDPVYAKGFQVIPAGSVVTGQVTSVKRASRKSNAGSMTVTFTRVQLPNGKSYVLNGSLTEGEKTDNEGQVKGGSSKKRNIAFVGGGAVVGALVNGAAGAGIGAGVGIAGALLSKGKEAEVKAGTEFNMILNRSLLLPEYRGGN
jgi:hypothetical protein